MTGAGHSGDAMPPLARGEALGRLGQIYGLAFQLRREKLETRALPTLSRHSIFFHAFPR